MPAFTNPFAIFIDAQDAFKGFLLFSGTGSATTAIYVDSKIGVGQVRIPSTFAGVIINTNASFGASLGSTAHPVGIITSQADLTTVLNWTTDTSYDGFYAITGFTPTSFSAGSIFGKQTAAGIATNVWWERQPTYNPATVRDVNSVYCFNQSTATWYLRSDKNNNVYANSYIAGLTSTATSSTTLTLTAGSSEIQRLTGSTAQTIILPKQKQNSQSK